MSRPLYRFHGGIHPPEHKLESSERPIRPAPLPTELILSLHQHIGTGAKLQVAIGERVLKGQLLAAAQGMISAAVHAPTSGTITAIAPHRVPHPSGLSGLCIHLQPDGAEQWIARTPLDPHTMDRTELLQHLQQGGIVGLGGATFPTHVKYQLPAGRSIQTLVINGVECEPWITADDRLMRERPDGIVRGIEILRHLARPAETLLAIEDNKPQALAAMRQACRGSAIEVVEIPTLYPSGGEKQLIRLLTGKEVPSGGRPADIGVICNNVATAYAVHRLIDHGEPMISRLITVTGHVATPQNFEVLIGTPLSALVALAGPLPDTTGYILGGPMMGLRTTELHWPVVKGSNCLIAQSSTLFPPEPPPMPCIRCTRCAQVCPASLQPQELYWFAQSKNFGKAQEYHLFDCIECGACAYVCPSRIPLVAYYRYAKSEIWERDRERKAAERARERHEFRQFRLEREKQEKAERLAQKEKAALAAQTAAAAQTAVPAANLPPDVDPEDTLRIRIQAAVERAKQQVQQETPRNTDRLTPEQQAEIAAIDARRARLHSTAQPTPQDEGD